MVGLGMVLRELLDNAAVARSREVRIRVLVSTARHVEEVSVDYEGRGWPRLFPSVGTGGASSPDAPELLIGDPRIRKEVHRCGGRMAARAYRVAHHFRARHFATITVAFKFPGRPLPPYADIPAAVARFYENNPRVDLDYVHKIDGTYFKLNFGEIGHMFKSHYPSAKETAKLAENFLSDSIGQASRADPVGSRSPRFEARSGRVAAGKSRGKRAL